MYRCTTTCLTWWWTFGYFLGVFMNKAVIHIRICRFRYGLMSAFLFGRYLIVWFVGLYVKCMFNVVSYITNCFPKGCSILYYRQQRVRAPVASHSQQHRMASFFLHSNRCIEISHEALIYIPLMTSRRSNQSILKEISPEYSCWSWNSNTLATWCEELTHLKRSWCWERLKAGEGDDRGWGGWMASPTQWTWVWVNSGSWWWTWKPGVL